MPMGYAVSAKPTAAMLEKLFVGQRSGVRPLFGSVRSQNQLKVRRSRVSRNAVSRGVSRAGGAGALTPVIEVALVDAELTASRTIDALRNVAPRGRIYLLRLKAFTNRQRKI